MGCARFVQPLTDSHGLRWKRLTLRGWWTTAAAAWSIDKHTTGGTARHEKYGPHGSAHSQRLSEFALGDNDGAASLCALLRRNQHTHTHTSHYLYLPHSLPVGQNETGIIFSLESINKKK